MFKRKKWMVKSQIVLRATKDKVFGTKKVLR